MAATCLIGIDTPPSASDNKNATIRPTIKTATTADSRRRILMELLCRDLLVPHEFMLGRQIRMEDFDQIFENQIRPCYTARPIVVGPGGSDHFVVEPHAPFANRLELLVTRLFLQHRFQA